MSGGPAAAMLGVGAFLQGLGNYISNIDQAEAESANADYFREQAAFAKKAGERQQMIHEHESVILYGEQKSAFAKAGVDTSSSSLFMAKETLFRQQEDQAIKTETDANVRLAMLRADQADKRADQLSDPGRNLLQMVTIGLGAAKSVL